MRVYDQASRKPAKWGHMALRQFVLPFAGALVSSCVIAIFGGLINAITTFAVLQLTVIAIAFVGFFCLLLVDAGWILKGDSKHRLVDNVAKTGVLNGATKRRFDPKLLNLRSY